MKTSHFFAASFGTLFIHVCIAYILSFSTQVLSKPAIREFIVTEVSFLEELKPTPSLEKYTPVIPQTMEPLIEKKPERKVIKEVAKVPSRKKIIQETAQEQSFSATNASFTQQSLTSQAVPSSVHEDASQKSGGNQDDLLLSYLLGVKQKIQASLRYPTLAKKMGAEGEAVVQFLILTNGMVDTSSIKIAKSSGKALLDRNAIDAVMEALPFPLPPQEGIEIKVPVVFKLTS